MDCCRTKCGPDSWLNLRPNSKLFIEIIQNDTPVFIALDPDAVRRAKNYKMFLNYGVNCIQ